MAQTASEHFLRHLPKAELHLHLEGSLEPAQMFEFARRNRVEIPFRSVEEVRAAYSFSNLQDFLDIYYTGAGVLRREEDFFDLARAYFDRAAADGVRHAEVFFDPQAHEDHGIPIDVVMRGFLAALDDARERHDISGGLILCFLRHLDEEAALATLHAAEPWQDRLLGVGLDSSELGHPPSKFARVFRAAGERGLHLVAHAGEEGPPAYVREALDLLAVERLDHGNRAIEDDDLVARLVRERVTLTVCPLSNLALRVVGRAEEHPLARMLDLGLHVTVNSDDPAYFGGYVAENYLVMARALGLGQKELVRLARNSFEGAFLDEDRRTRLLAELDTFVDMETLK